MGKFLERKSRMTASRDEGGWERTDLHLGMEGRGMKGKRGRQTFLTRMVRAWSKVEAVRRKKGKEKRHFPERNELNLVNGPHTVKQFQPRLQERGGCNSSQDGRQGTAL